MKKQAFRILAVFSLLLTMSAAIVHAQTKRSTINIPFSFTVGHKTLPAGEYTVEPNRGNSDNVWLVESTTGHDNVVFTTGSAWTRETQENTKLVFNNYDGQYFLSQIWSAGDNTGRELRMPRLERQLAKSRIQRERVIVTRGAGE
ncbi:MAG TPA: hypothetical protein VE977_01970 [Pyrinomonadaceae bacterium]|nr:hypothetical protein [Pyrinomonadaceae bacterium]